MKTGLTNKQKVTEICSIGKATWGPRTGMEVNNATLQVPCLHDKI